MNNNHRPAGESGGRRRISWLGAVPVRGVRSGLFLVFTLGWLFAGLVLGAGCASRPHGDPLSGAELQRFEFTRPEMGVPFRIVVYAGASTNAAAAAEAAFARVAALNSILSDYDPDSELNRLCHEAPVGKPVRVSPELGFMLERSTALSRKTDGAFDVTVGPLVNLWRRARRHGELPPEALIAEAKSRVGWDRLRLDREARTVTFLVAGMRLDFGAIAKGYAVDEAGRVLRAHKLNRFLVAAAGDIRAWDPPPGQRGWRVEVGGSDATNAPAARVAWLRRAAVSTSGDIFQKLEIGGRRYSHILSPKTGVGLTDRCLVTVLARDGVTADSVSTAVSVLGPERGLRLVEGTAGADVLILRGAGDGGEVERVQSRGLEKWLAPR